MQDPDRPRSNGSTALAGLDRALLDILPHGVAVFHLDDPEDPGSLRLVRANDAASRAVGFDAKAEIGRTFREGLPQALETDLPATYAEVARTGEPRDLGLVTYGDDRIERSTFRIRAYPLPERHVAVVFQDVSKETETEAWLQMLTSALANARDAVLITGPNLDEPGPEIIYANDAFERLTGYTPEEVWGRSPRFLQGPDTDRAVLGRLREQLERGETFHGEAINYRKDGTPFVMEWEIAPIRGSHGAVTHWVATQRDVTERRRQALRFRGVFDSAFQHIFLARPDGTLLEVNRTALDFVGVPAEDVLGAPIWDGPWWGLSYGTRAELRDAVGRAAGGDLVRYVVDVQGEGDIVATLDLSIKPMHTRTGSVEVLIIEGRDITEGVRTQRELRDVREMQERLEAQQARYRSLVDATSAIVWTTSSESGLTGGEASWTAFTGRELGAADDSWLDAIHPDDRAATLEAWERSLATNTPFEVEHRLRRHDGAYRHMLVRGVPVFDEDGRVKEWVGTHTDIHDRKRAEVRAQFLAGAGTILTGGLDFQTTLRHVAELAVPGFADWCAVKLVDDGGLRDLAVAHVDAEKVRWAEELQHRFPDDPDAPTGVPNVIRTGQSELYADVPEELLVQSARSEEHLALLREVGFRSAIVVPLEANDEAIGAITFVTAESGRHFEEGDLEVAEELGRRAGTAIENARLQEALRASEARHRFMAETLQQQIWTAGPDGRLEYVNRYTLDYFGRTHAEMIGEGWQAVVHPDDMSEVGQRWAHSLETGDPYEVEFRLCRAEDDEWRWHIGRASALRDDDGRITKWFGANTDIHEKKEAEDVLAEANRALEERVAERTRDLAAFTDDLKALHRITTAEHESTEEFLQDYIRTGCAIFEMPVGILSETPYDEASGAYRYRVLLTESTVPSMQAGWEAPLSDSFCEVVMERAATVSYADAREEGEAVRSKPPYAEYGLRSFIGTPIWVDEEVFGTLKFTSPEPRPGGFDTLEHELIEILAEHIGRLLSVQRAEARRAEADARYRSVVQTINEGLLLVSADGSILVSNPAAKEMLGLDDSAGSSAEGDETPRWRVIDDHGRPVVEHDLPERKVLRTGEPVGGVVQGIVAPDGRVRWYSVNARAVSHTPEGDAASVVVTFSDVTEQRQAEAELRAREEQLRKAQEIARVGSWRWEVAADEITWSDQLYRIFGLTPDAFEPMFESYLQALHPEDREQVQQTVQAAVERQESYEVDHRVVRPDGEVRHVFSIGEVVLDAEGRTAALQGTAQDVTEQRQTEQDLRHYAAALEERNAELEQFAYVASHDLQEPLRMVSSFLQLLQRRYGGALDETADEYIAYAVDGAKRMQVLIQDLLAYSRVGTRGKPFEPVDMNRAVETVLTDLGPALDEFGAEVHVERLPTIRADESQMRQLLQNLIGNAVKFRGEHPPEVRVGAERARPPGPEGASASGWRFSVSDNGIGIASEHGERIFQIFQRLHTRDEYEGTGIGLAMCKKIVERHGGHIWLESDLGEGATFYFWLPDRPPEDQGIPSRRSAAQSV